MKTNHTADEIVTIEGPQDHSLDFDRVYTVIKDEMRRVETAYVTFYFIYNGKHRTHSDDFKASDKWGSIMATLFDEPGVDSVYKVTIQPSDQLGKAKRLQENPREHRSTSRQGHYVANLLRNPVTATGSRYSADEPDLSAQTMSHL